MSNVLLDESSARTSGAREARPRPNFGVLSRRGFVFLYLGMLVVWPVWLVVWHTFADGNHLNTALADPTVIFALQMSLVVAFWAVLINTVFGVSISLLLVHHEFPGKRLLSALIDLPLSVSPVVIGLALILAYGPSDGLFAGPLNAVGFQIIFAVPGIVMATAFVSLPLVIREVIPVLKEIGTEQEQAARSLGANSWQTFWRITLPSIKWALTYGVVLSLARSLGEFGAVKIVSGNVSGHTQTATLVVEDKYLEFEQGTAYATSFLLTLVAVAALVVVMVIRPKEHADGN